MLPFQSVIELSALEGEFLDYQLMETTEIPSSVWESPATVSESDPTTYKIDSLWSYLVGMKNGDGTYRFEKLCKVAMLVLILPHSNAPEERVFSMISKNKTKFRPNLQLDGTLSSIICVKLANTEPCSSYNPPKDILETAKKATKEYNKLHSKNK